MDVVEPPSTESILEAWRNSVARQNWTKFKSNGAVYALRQCLLYIHIYTYSPTPQPGPCGFINTAELVEV
jgi:hypothetical protein